MLRRRLLRPLGALTLLCIAAAGCGQDAAPGPGAGSAPGESLTGLSDQGLVVLTEDEAHRGRTPEELEADEVRLYYHDFGRVRLGETVRHLFRLENTDSQPVAITRMQPSCQCTTAELRFLDADGVEQRVRSASRSAPPTIPPGGVAELTMTLNTARSEPTSHNTDKLYTVQVMTDSVHRGFLRFEAHIIVERAFQATPQPLKLGQVSRNGGGSGKVEIIAVGEADARLVGVGPLPPGVRADLITEPSFGSTLWTLEVTLLPPLEPGPILREFELMTQDAEDLPYHPFPIEVHAFVTEDLSHSPQRFLMRGAAVADGPLETTVEVYSLLEGERLLIRDAKLVGEGTDALDVRVVPNLRDAKGKSERWTVHLATKPPFRGEAVRGQVVLSIDGHEDLAIELMVHPN